MEQLKACYDKYIAEAAQVWKNRPVLDGVLGMRSSTKDHPCHVEFFEAVSAWVDGFVKSDPTAEQAEEAVSFVLQTSEQYKGQFTYWAMFAAHGLMRPLIPLVSPQYAARTRQWYNEHVPRADRLPVHKDLFKLLKKREKA